jgi:hypothetical protein
MAAKYNCGQCGKRHRPGDCEMAGEKKESGWPWRRPARKAPEKPLCFPHRWAWSQYTRVSRVMHERHKECSKCHEPKPGSRDISRHKFRSGSCSQCGELNHTDKSGVSR